eukprot:1157769-Pelagomonas_calceolata.AAC.2
MGSERSTGADRAMQELVSIIYEVAKQSRPMYNSKERLAYDLAVLLSGARPCVMLGCVMTHDNCHYVANHPEMMKHLDRLLSYPSSGHLTGPIPMPALIGFCEEGGTLTPAVLSDQDTKMYIVVCAVRSCFICGPNILLKWGQDEVTT